MNKLQILISYIKDRLLFATLALGSILIYSSVYFIYNIKLEAIIYATYLFLLVLGVSFSLDFLMYYKKHRQLIKWKNDVLYSEYMPKRANIIESDYLDIVKEIKNKYYKNESNNNEKFEEIEDYFTLWVHQVKLPISAMKLLIETEQKPDKKLLKSELFRINQYTDMVLTYLRINSTYSDYIFAEHDLDNLIRQAIRKFSSEFIRKKVTIHFDETNCKVLTDEKWLVFVLEQLISNAIKYTEKGSVHIYGKDSVLYIEDTGIGIESSDLPRIFDKGYTGFNGRTDKKASGLGLYLCKKIMDKLSHKLEIESEVGIGTRVILHLEHKDLRVE